MERREDIRAAMQSLLSSARRPDSRSGAAVPERQTAGSVGIRIHPHHEAMLAELRQELQRHGINAADAEILQALCDALAHRPAIYKGLLAAYLLTP